MDVLVVQFLLHWYLLFEFPASSLSLRSADKVGRPFCCCIVFSFLLFLFYYFISFLLSAFCDFSAIFHRISLIFGQLVDNKYLVEELYSFSGTKVKGQGHKVTLDENAYSAISLSFIIFSFISFPLSAFCDFSAICNRISLIFSQLVDNNL